MNDDLGLFSDEPEEQGHRRGRRNRLRRRRQSWMSAVAGLFVLAIVGGGVLYGAGQLMNIGTYSDYEGAGSGEVVIQVKRGDSTSAIAAALQRQGVVASTKAFTSAAENNARISAIQPGYYMLRSHMSGAAAVERIVSPEAKVGQLEIRGGTRLDDVHGPDGQVTPGILTMLSQASCTEEGGQQRCVPVNELRRVAETADLSELGVPEWAMVGASKAEPKHRLEGLFMPGRYNVQPGVGARELLRSVLKSSVSKLEATGLPEIAESTGSTPYEVLTVASLAQSEAVTSDFGKVARVVYNRRDKGMPLQFDSTINYPLDRPTLLTSSADRAKPGPYNTYRNTRLPPTPISSVSAEAIEAAARPVPGDWVYFVKCESSGKSCFSVTPRQHQDAIRQAQERGVY